VRANQRQDYFDGFHFTEWESQIKRQALVVNSSVLQNVGKSASLKNLIDNVF